MKRPSNSLSPSQVCPMLCGIWKKEMGIDIFIRNPKGITLTKDGMEFLSYARQVVEQTQLLEERYKNPVANQGLFSVSSQHYAFVVEAFVSLLKKSDMEKYELFLQGDQNLGNHR